jgi:hypothetical protein
MKKVILSIALLSGVAFTSQAQTEKGKFIVGGNASYSTFKSDADNAKASHNFSIVPNLGYFVSDNIAIGTGIGYQSSKASAASPIGKQEAFVIAPFGRHYTPIAGSFKFFGQLSVPMAFGTTKATDADLKVGDKNGNSTSIGVALSPGFAFYPSSKIGIEFAFNGISYINESFEDANGDKIKGKGGDSFAIGTNFFAPKIGIQFHF